MISSTFPYPPSRGGTEIRTFNLLKHLQQKHSVTLLTQRNDTVSEAEVHELEAWVDRLVVFSFPQEVLSRHRFDRWLDYVERLTTVCSQGIPPNVLYRYSPAMQTWVNHAVRFGHYDVITCEHSVNEIYIRPEFCPRVKTVVNIHSSVYAWTRNHLAQRASPHPWRDRLYLPLLRRYEQRYCRKFSHIVVTTEDDRQELQRFQPPAPIDVIPNGVDLDLFSYRSHDPNNRDLIFVGAMDASHNIDAARFFALKVFPQLRQIYPDATFRIVGVRPTAAVQQLARQPGVVVTGKVDLMVEQLHQATVCVVPLRTGFGIKNKTLEAMAAGVPVVGSDRGLEGLAVDASHLSQRAIRANQVKDYIEAISRLFENPTLRTELSQAARVFVETEYTWDRVGQQYASVLTNGGFGGL